MGSRGSIKEQRPSDGFPSGLVAAAVFAVCALHVVPPSSSHLVISPPSSAAERPVLLYSDVEFPIHQDATGPQE